MFRRVLFLVLVCTAASGTAFAQFNRIDTIAPFAPELAAYGNHAIGVRTLQVTDRNRPDVLNTKEGHATAIYDRTLTLEIWYPARLTADQKPGGEYRVVTRDPAITAILHGKAVRNAAPAAGQGAFPLVIISHGYPGNRFLMSHLAENLATKGFVVVSIDHKDSTYDDQKALASTLYNRPFDQIFVLNEMSRQGKARSGSVFSGLVDDSRTALVGYSMGAYGVVNVIGGGYSKASETLAGAPPNALLARRGAANAEYRNGRDPRVKAAIAIAPWGMQTGFWDADGLKGIRTPVLFVAGSVDDVAGYERGTKAIYRGAVNADRYLLTYVNANHNAGAPIPAPVETYAYSNALRGYPFTHYADPVWDNVRMNNILQHFTTAFLDLHLKGEQEKRAYLDGSWKGFTPRTAAGLTLEHADPSPAPSPSPQAVSPDAHGFIAAQPEDLQPRAGVTQVVIAGDPTKPGIYVVRNTFAPGRGSRPHFHDQDRYVTVLKGTWWVVLGPDADVYNPDKMVPMKPGSFIKHPAGGHHYDGAKDEEVVVEIIGMGPVTTTQLAPGAR